MDLAPRCDQESSLIFISVKLVSLHTNITEQMQRTRSVQYKTEWGYFNPK